MKLHDKVALITGSARGLGWEMVQAFAQDTVKIAYVDPLSGGGASIGEVGLKTFQFLADEINAKGGLLGRHLELHLEESATDDAVAAHAPQSSAVARSSDVRPRTSSVTASRGARPIEVRRTPSGVLIRR